MLGHKIALASIHVTLPTRWLFLGQQIQLDFKNPAENFTLAAQAQTYAIMLL